MRLARQTVRALALSVVLLACSGAPPDAPVSNTSAIVGGVGVTGDYPEFVAVDLAREICSGVLIGPRTVLTAGHCATKGDVTVSATVQGTPIRAYGHGVPFEMFDDRTDEARMDVTIHDVGVILLDDDISLAAYPAVAMNPVADGTELVMLGRVKDGAWTHTANAGSVRVRDGATAGFPLAYVSDPAIGEPGDSGGPLLLVTGTTRTVVAVHSRNAGTFDAPRDGHARVDQVHDWVASYLAGKPAEGPAQPEPACPFSCSAYGYAAGQCEQGWYCDGRCVTYTGCR